METGFMPVGSATAIHQGGNNAGNGGVTNRVIRAPNLKRGKMEEAISDRIKLEAVFGLTVSSNAALDCDPFTEVVAYPAGCTVVLYNVRKKRQSHVLNASRKSVTCVTFSPDGRYLATGECGHAPAVRVWDLHDPTSVTPSVQVAEFPSHTHGVSCVAFSKSCKYLVSIGSQHDMIVNVWDWKAGVKLASNKVSSRVNSVSFAQDGGYFVTVGFRHVKFWYLDSRQAKIKEPVPLMGRSAILGTLKDNDFCAVCCGKDECESSTFAVTASGLLCEFNSRRLLDKWVELRTTSANCMAIGSKLIFIGCADGIIRCFSPNTLQFITTLPRPHYLGVDVNQGTNISHMFSHPKGAQYPDAVAITYDERNHKVTCVYNDHSLYVWDVRDIKRVGKCHSALYHAACIWGVDVIPPPEGKQPGGETRFITCSSDDTVRIWSMNGPQSQGQTNVYSNELEKVLYIDPELTYLKDIDLTTNSDKDKAKSYDDKTGVRCVRLSPDGVHIASGDRSGNIWIHRIIDGKCLFTLEAHDAEVLSLEYSPQTSDYSNTPRLLASASRDRLLHIFNRDQGYQIMQTLDDHSSSIMAVRFLNTTAGLQMVSCGADKTILFRTLVQTKDGYQFVRGHNASTRCTLYDMEIDFGGKHVLTACQDRNVRVYSSSNARHTKTFRATVAEDGTLIKVALDTSGIYLATSSTDKILCVYDYYSGECMATVCGHSEIVTGLKFTPDCEYLISASGDGCLFVWRMPHDMVITMRARLSQQAIRMGRKVSTSINGGAAKGESENEGSPPRDLQDYALRIGRLPSWAKKSLGDELSNTANKSPENLNSQPSVVSKWATRVQDKRLESDGSKDSSIDSGTDSRSATERRTYTKQRPKSVNLEQLLRTQDLFRRAKNYTSDTEFVKKVVIMTESPKNADLNRIRHHTDDSSLGSFKYEEQEGSEDHDGDIEDISDGERTSSSERNHNATTYYIDNNDSENTPSEFMVNAMDVEELRKSQRRSKRWKTTATTPEDASALSSHHVTSVGAASASSHVTSLSGSDDDDELSTPSGDNADRTLMDAVKKVNPIHKAYECLSGSEPDKFTHSTTSLSSQHMSRSITNKPEIRLMPPPQSVPPPKSAGGAGNNVSAETSRAREELQRRILETRRQLESVGYRSNLKSSQSTTDLSYGSNVKRQSSFNNKQQNLYGQQQTSRIHLDPNDNQDDTLRRAISLSDLHQSKGYGGNTAGRLQVKREMSAVSSSAKSRAQQRYHNKNTNNMMRSSSVGRLNQQNSDSESDTAPSVSSNGRNNSRPNQSSVGVMRPTISSLNKVATARRGNTLQGAHSAMNLAVGMSAAGGNGSSSDGEGGERRKRNHGLSAKAREVTARLTRSTSRLNSEGTQSSEQLAASLSEQLRKTACKVSALYKTMQNEHPNSINELEQAMMETQAVLRATLSRSTDSGHGSSRGDSNSLEENAAMSMIEQYSDLLLSMMQNKVTQHPAVGPNSMPDS